MLSGEIHTIPDQHGNRDEHEEKQSQTLWPSEVIRWIQISPYPRTSYRSTSRHLSHTQQKQRRVGESDSMKQKKAESVKVSTSESSDPGMSRTERERDEFP